MKILITGVAGFIGFSLANKLLKNKKNLVYGIDNFDRYYSPSYKKRRISRIISNKRFFFLSTEMPIGLGPEPIWVFEFFKKSMTDTLSLSGLDTNTFLEVWSKYIAAGLCPTLISLTFSLVLRFITSTLLLSWLVIKAKSSEREVVKKKIGIKKKNILLFYFN